MATSTPSLSTRLEKLLGETDRKARLSHVLRSIESAAVDLSDRAQENLSDLIEWIIEAEKAVQAGKATGLAAEFEQQMEAAPPPMDEDDDDAPLTPAPAKKKLKSALELVGPPAVGKVPIARIHIDGGARGNPGPAAIGIVMTDDGDETVWTHCATIGEATNNVAEYTALVRALTEARRLRVQEVEVRSDSELIVKQVRGEYRVKNEILQPLWQEAVALAREFSKFRIRHVPRAQNKLADQLVNQSLDEAMEG